MPGIQMGLAGVHQWAELREVCLVISHELWPLTLCTYIWAVLKGLTL